MRISVEYNPSVAELADFFSNLDNHQMLAFFECVTELYKRDCKRGVFALYDQFLAVVQDQDMTQDTRTALEHLQRDSLWSLQHYKP